MADLALLYRLPCKTGYRLASATQRMRFAGPLTRHIYPYELVGVARYKRDSLTVCTPGGPELRECVRLTSGAIYRDQWLRGTVAKVERVVFPNSLILESGSPFDHGLQAIRCEYG